MTKGYRWLEGERDDLTSRRGDPVGGLRAWDGTARSAHNADLVCAIAAGAAAILAAAVTLLATARGPGLSPDSANYLSAGLNLSAGRGLRTFTGSELTVFPPGLPSIVAVAHMLGLSAAWTVRLLNSSAFALSVWLGFLLLRRHLHSKALVVGGTILLAVSAPLLDVSEMAWTEPAFIVVTLALILLLENLARSRRPAPLLVAAATLVWVGFMLRYAGIVLVPAGALGVWFGVRRRGRRSAALACSIFVLLAMSVPLAWMGRNHRVDGTYLGPRSPSSDGLATIANRIISTLGGWTLPQAPTRFQALIGGAAIVLVLAAALWLIVSQRSLSTVLAEPERPVSLVPLACYCLSYVTYLVLAQLTTAFDAIGSRLMSPLYVPLVVLVLVGVDRLPRSVPGLSPRVVGVTIGSAMAVLVLVQGAALSWDARDSSTNGQLFATRAWQSSPLAQAVKGLPPGSHIYSNVPDGIWASVGREPIMFSPLKRGYRSSKPLLISPTFEATAACPGSYLAWSKLVGPGDFFTPGALDRYVTLTPVATTPDGALYGIGPLASRGGPRGVLRGRRPDEAKGVGAGDHRGQGIVPVGNIPVVLAGCRNRDSDESVIAPR